MLSEHPTRAERPLVSIIMPAYNERATILTILARVLASPIPKEVIIVDDGSTDGTTDILRAQVDGRMAGTTVLYHQHNRGKGAAVRTALPACRGEIIIIQDSDLEYDPSDYPALLQPIRDGRADVVFGSRFIGGPAHRVHLFWHRVGNALLTTLCNLMTGLNLTDMEVGYKAFRADVLRSLHLRSDRFDFEPEVTVKVAKRRYRVYEVPVSYSGRDYAEGKKVTWLDGVIALWKIVRYRIAD